MEYKYPIAKEDGKDYTAAELYGKLSNERAGHYLLSANGFWHGGIHFSTPNISDKTLVQAIAEGTVIAYRINKEYEIIPAETPPEGFKYSTGFCLIKHSIPVEKSSQLKQEEAEKEKQEAEKKTAEERKQLAGKQITLTNGRNYRDTETAKGTAKGTYEKGSTLEIISVSDTLKENFYFAKVKQIASATEGKAIIAGEHYVALLDKDSKPASSFFEMPTDQTASPQNTDDNAAEADKKVESKPEEKPNPNTFNLEFYSLYMHLSAYEDYEPKKEEKKTDEKETKKENERVTIKATNLTIRDKHRDETGSKVIGKVSNGAVLEVLETKESANKTFTDIKAKLVSGNFTDSAGKKLDNITEAWVTTRQDKKSFIEDKKEEAKQAEQARKRPSYWEGTVTAVVKKADGIKIWQTLEGNELKTELGTISLNNQFTFDSTQTKTITVDKKTLLIAECTAIGTFTFRAKGDQPKGKFWTTVDKDSITRTKVEPTVFNTVVPCNTKIIAGEPLGYLGTYETPSQTDDKNSKKQVHVEVFTPDITTVQFLLNNPFKLTGKKYIKVAKGTKLLGAIPSNQTPSILQENKEYEHSSIDYTTKNDHYLVIDDLKTEKQLLTNVEYYKIAVELHTGYLKKDGLEEIDQYDWSKLGFKTVEEPNKDADGYLDPKAMSAIFQQIYSQIDTNKDGKLQPDELKAALKDDGIRDQWSKLIALHPSEWKTDTRAIVARFTKLLTNVFAPKAQQEKAQELLLQETLRMNSLAFLEQVVPPVPPMLYHFHPVTFVEYLENDYSYYIDKDGYIQGAEVIRHTIKQAERGTLAKVNAVVVHRTDSYDLISARNQAKSGVAAHFLVDKDGSIYQIASLFQLTYHVGNIRPKCEKDGVIHYKNIYSTKTYGKAIKEISDLEKKKAYPERYPMNSDSVGIEVVAKCLKSSNDGLSGTWEKATSKQLESVKKLVRILQREYKLNDQDLYQHQYISYKTHGEGSGLHPVADNNSNVNSKL